MKCFERRKAGRILSTNITTKYKRYDAVKKCTDEMARRMPHLEGRSGSDVFFRGERGDWLTPAHDDFDWKRNYLIDGWIDTI